MFKFIKNVAFMIMFKKILSYQVEISSFPNIPQKLIFNINLILQKSKKYIFFVNRLKIKGYYVKKSNFFLNLPLANH